MSQYVLNFFKRTFDCEVPSLRMDRGGEYQNFDMLSKALGVTRQVSEDGNQACNGKPERMHKTVLNMAW